MATISSASDNGVRETKDLSMKTAIAAAMLTLVTLGAAKAADPFVPRTGSAQDITVPHALPGEPTHRHDPATEGHLIAPTGQQAKANERGVEPTNASPGSGARVGEAQPHVDVTSPRGVVPEVGSAQGANPPGSSR